MSEPEVSRALFYPFAEQVLFVPSEGDVLFLYAEPGPELDLLPKSRTVIYQPHQPHADVLEKLGWKVVAGDAPLGSFRLAFLKIPKQHEEMCYALAIATNALAQNGLLVCAGGNSEGGKRIGKCFDLLGLEAQSLSKHKCRIVWAQVSGKKDIANDWLAAGRMQPVMDGRFMSQPGLFSWDRVDIGSAVLAQHLPAGLSGAGADFGCGYGYLSDHVLRNNPTVKRFLCADADARAIEACRINLGKIKTEASAEYLWTDLARQDSVPAGTLDFIIMNPPFHQGAKTVSSIGQAFIRTAFFALRPGGALYMVANVHLPYEPVLAALFSAQEQMAVEYGFKVIKATKAVKSFL